MILGADTNNSDCYMVPIADIEKWGSTKLLSQLQDYKENCHNINKYNADTWKIYQKSFQKHGIFLATSSQLTSKIKMEELVII